MSHYDSETGVYILPPKEFTRLRAALKSEWDAQMQAMFERVLTVYREHPGIVFHDAVRVINRDPGLADWQIELVRGLVLQTGHGGLAKPTKKALKDVEFEAIVKAQPMYADQGVEVIPLWQGGIYLYPDDHRVEWRIEADNHAVDEAHAHPLGKKFLSVLAGILWTEGTGGKMTYQNECGTRVYREYGHLTEEVVA